MTNNHKVISYKSYVAGWLNSSIAAFLQVLPSAASSTKFALITSLDSEIKLDRLLRNNSLFSSLIPGAEKMGNGILIQSDYLQRPEVNSQLFFGFDEVWFFPTRNIQPKPNSVWLVGPARVDQDSMSEIGPWMHRNACSLGLGDGEGLNFILKARGLLPYLLSHSLQQSSTTMTVLNALDESYNEEAG